MGKRRTDLHLHVNAPAVFFEPLIASDRLVRREDRAELAAVSERQGLMASADSQDRVRKVSYPVQECLEGLRVRLEWGVVGSKYDPVRLSSMA